MDKLGINLASLIAFTLNFGLLFYILNRFLFGSVRKQLDERRLRIEAALGAAEKAAEDARDSERRVQEQIRQAQLQGQEIVANAQQLSQRIQDDAASQAQVRAQQILAQAEVTIRQETETARAELRKEFADLTVLAAERVINQSLDRQAHLRLINEVLAEAAQGRNN